MSAVSWKSGVSGDWSQAADWSTGLVPGAGDDVTISIAGTYVVTVSTTEAAHSVTLGYSGATLQIGAKLSVGTSFSATAGKVAIGAFQTLALAGPTGFGLVNNYGPTVAGPGALTTAGTTTLVTQTYSYPDLYLSGGVTWTNTGAVNAGGQIDIGVTTSDTAALVNQAGAHFNLTDDVASIVNYTTNDSSTFTNAGTLAKTAGTGTSTIASMVTNTGTISVASGTLEFDDGGSFGGTISGAGTVAFAAGNSAISGTATAALLVDGGAVNLTSAAHISGSFSATNGTVVVGTGQAPVLTGPVSFGRINNFGPTVTGGGSLTTSGTTTLVTQTAAYVDAYFGGGLTWTNAGTVNLGGQIDAGATSYDSAKFVNNAAANFNLIDDFADIVNYTTGDTSTFANAGHFTKTAGTGTNNIYSLFTNTGTIAVASGTIEFDGGGSFGGTISGAGTVAFASGGSTLSATVSAAVLIDGGSVNLSSAAHISGAFSATNGTVVVGSGQAPVLTGAVTFGRVSNFGPTVTGGGDLTTNGTTTAMAQTAAYVDAYFGGGLTWTNAGTVNLGGQIDAGATSYDSAAFVNDATANFNLTNDFSDIVSYTTGDASTFANAGHFTKTAGTGTNNIDSVFTNTGTITVSSGTIEFDGGGSFGGTISGAGTVAFGSGDSTLSATASAAVLIDGGSVNLTSAAHISGAFSATNGTIVVGSGQAPVLTGAVTFGRASNFGPTVTGGGNLTTNGTTTMVTQTAAYVDAYFGGGLTWTNAGTVNLGGQIDTGATSYDSAKFVNNSTANFNLTDDFADIVNYTTGDTSTFANAGHFTKTAGTGINNIDSLFTNTGTIAVTSGTIEFDGGGSFGGTISGAGTVAFGSGGSTLSATASAAVLIDGGSVNLTSAAHVSGAFSATNGTLIVASGQAPVLTGAVSFGRASNYGPTVTGGGSLTTNGITTAVAQTAAYVDAYFGGGLTWTNAGTVNLGGQVDAGATSYDSAAFVNNSTANFNLTDDFADIVSYTTGDASTFANAGHFTKTAGTGTNNIDSVFTNTGTIAVTSGTIEFDGGGSFGGTITGAGTVAFAAGNSTISAAATAALLVDGASVNLTSASHISGGFSVTNGTLIVGSGQAPVLTGPVSFGRPSNYGPTLTGAGVLTTNGSTTVVAQTAAFVDLYLSGGVTWANGGTVNDGGQIDIGVGQYDNAALVNNASGAFNLTDDFASIVNYTNFDTSTFSNAGRLAKTAGTGTSTIASTITNTGSIVAASGTLSLPGHLTNLVGTTITGGAYQADASSTLQLANNVSITVDAASLTLQGAGSTIESLNTSTSTQVTLDSTLFDITAAGALHVLGGRNFTVVGNGGNLLDSGLVDLGGGTLVATSVNLGGTGTLSGFGTVTTPVNSTGTVQAVGGTLNLTGDSLPMLPGTTLVAHGALGAYANSTLQLAVNRTIVTDSGTITLSGANSAIESLNTTTTKQVTVDTTLATISAGGALNLLAGRSFTVGATGSALSDSGVLNLGGGTFTATTLTINAGGSLTGFGTVAGAVHNSGSIAAVGGTLFIEQAVTGTESAAAGATLKLGAGGALTGAITGAGTLELSGATPYTLATTLPIAAVKVDAGATLSGTGTISGTLADSGTVTASGGTLSVGGAVSGAGTLSAASGSVLDLKAGGSFGGALSGAGKIQIDGAATLTSGASLSATSVQENANVTLNSGVALTNAAGHTYTIAAGSGATVTLGGAGSFTNAGTLANTGAGQVNIDAGTALINSASISVGSGKMEFLTPVNGTGTISIAAGATAALMDGAAATQTVKFAATTGELDLAKPLSFLGTIAGFGGSDRIDLLNTVETSDSFGGGKLTVKDGTTTVANLAFSGTYATSNFVLASDTHGGTLITWHS